MLIYVSNFTSFNSYLASPYSNSTYYYSFTYRGLELGLLVTTISVANEFRLGGSSVQGRLAQELDATLTNFKKNPDGHLWNPTHDLVRRNIYFYPLDYGARPCYINVNT